MSDDMLLYVLLAVFVLGGTVISLIYYARYSRRVERQLQDVDEINCRTMDVLERWERIASRLEPVLEKLEDRL